jgi:CO/xanthine dehydrogenase Mo-binding subunit
MSERFVPEPERYEFTESPAYTFALNRRDFLRFGGAGILVCIAAPAFTQETAQGPRMTPQPAPTDVSGWLHIDPQGRTTAYTGKVEIGQNIRTSLAQSVADELSVALSSVTMVMGDTDTTPFDIGTVGSFTTPQVMPQLRRAAAVARTAALERTGGGTDHRRRRGPACPLEPDRRIRRADPRRTSRPPDSGGGSDQARNPVDRGRPGGDQSRQRSHRHGPAEVRLGRDAARNALRKDRAAVRDGRGAGIG